MGRLYSLEGKDWKYSRLVESEWDAAERRFKAGPRGFLSQNIVSLPWCFYADTFVPSIIRNKGAYRVFFDDTMP